MGEPIHAGERIGNARERKGTQGNARERKGTQGNAREHKERKNSDNSNEALLLLLVTTNLMIT